MCLGLAMSESGGPPSVLHGDSEILMTSLAVGLYGMTKPVHGYRIVDRGESRDERLTRFIQAGGEIGLRKWRKAVSSMFAPAPLRSEKTGVS